MSYSIKLPQFEGPFDLLLFFIERDELDIYDIPIAKITDDFLDYIHHMKILNIDLASEFILVAATLMRIKAKTLLPRKEVDEQGNEIDPRKELIDRLLEYKKYKALTEDLRLMELSRQSVEKRGFVNNELSSISQSYATEMELHDLNLFNLLKVFQKVLEQMDKNKNKVEHKVIRYSYTIEGEKENILGLAQSGDEVSFEKIFLNCENRVHAIFTFLAMLELIQLKVLLIQTGMGINNFWIKRAA